MAAKQIGVTLGGNVKNYQCFTTDAKGTWPTDCGPSSRMVVINATTHAVDHFEYYDGTNWDTYL